MKPGCVLPCGSLKCPRGRCVDLQVPASHVGGFSASSVQRLVKWEVHKYRGLSVEKDKCES